MFNLVGILITLKHFHLQMKNLDWPNDLCLNCMKNENFKDYLKVEVVLVENNNELIEEFEYFEKLRVDSD
jgi:hypothetical protein